MILKRVLLASGLLFATVPGTVAAATLSSPSMDRLAVADTLDALTDFTLEVEGFAPYYREPMRDGHPGIAINSVEYEGEFAAADHVWTGAAGVFDLTLGIRPEFDGECTYILYINGTAQRLTVGKRTEVPIEPPTPHTWTGIALATGDTIRVSSNSATNGLLPEGEGTGFARGRWSWLVVTPAP